MLVHVYFDQQTDAFHMVFKLTERHFLGVCLILDIYIVLNQTQPIKAKRQAQGTGLPLYILILLELL